jgi:2-polyprenyl-6-methoxyphenol hydroxylase-like FAD-dependent oxidoreductase
MQQQVIIVGGGMVGSALLMLAKSNIAVKLLEAVKYPNYDDKMLPLIIPVLMRVIPLCHVVAYRFIRS